MRHRLFLFLWLLGTIAGPSASARDTGPTHVGAEADLIEMGADGQPIPSIVKYHLARNDDAKRPVSLSFTEGPGPCSPPRLCPMMPTRLREFQILGETQDRCGSVRYEAIAVVPSGAQWAAAGLKLTRPARLTLTDHTHRRCDDFRAYLWEVAIADPGHAKRRFAGNPAPLDPTPSCGDIAKETLCTLEVQPTVCSVRSVAGTPLPTPVAASGQNRCAAIRDIESVLCEQGLDWKRIDDPTCVTAVQMCPIPECAAPPPGCNYVPDPTQKDANGCPLGCGRLACDAGGPLPKNP